VFPRATVLAALRRFVPAWLKTAPTLWPHQRRALWAIDHCRTSALGGQAFGCKQCGRLHFAYHSCNHKACPQCGAQATARWIRRELRKRVDAPYFLVTFTLPSELRGLFFGPQAKEAYDLYFAAVSGALSEKLTADKGLRAPIHGFTAVLHTWTQKLEFHPHIHCLVPGVGLNAQGKLVRVKSPKRLVHLAHLQGAFRQHLYRLLKEKNWSVDPTVWRKDWGVHIQPAGSGTAAVKYLGAYVARTAISDKRILAVSEDAVTFRWKDRAHGNRPETLTLPGVEFVARYFRHVLPTGLRSVRYYGFHHPTAKAKRLQVQLHSGMPVDLGSCSRSAPEDSGRPKCPVCGQPMQPLCLLPFANKTRGPPVPSAAPTLTPVAA
jgi:hypothetical protein